MHNQINSRRNLSAHRRQRNFHPHQHHCLDSRKHILRAVGMACTDRAVMSGIERLQKINCLTPTNFSHENPVRTHTQTAFQQIPDRHLLLPLRIRIPRLHAHQIFHALKLQLSIILNGDNPLILRNVIRQSIHKSGFARACPA